MNTCFDYDSEISLIADFAQHHPSSSPSGVLEPLVICDEFPYIMGCERSHTRIAVPNEVSTDNWGPICIDETTDNTNRGGIYARF